MAGTVSLSQEETWRPDTGCVSLAPSGKGVVNLMRVIGSVFAILIAMLATASLLASEGKLVHVVRFADYEQGPVEDWLQSKGFQFKEDAQRRDRIELDVGENGLALEAKHRAFGFMPNESVNVPEFTYVEIDWGVNKFPEGTAFGEQFLSAVAQSRFKHLSANRRAEALFEHADRHFAGTEPGNAGVLAHLAQAAVDPRFDIGGGDGHLEIFE